MGLGWDFTGNGTGMILLFGKSFWRIVSGVGNIVYFCLDI